MNNAEYQALPAVSSHWLIDMLVSPAHCYRRHLDPARVIEPSSDALRLGTLVHCLALTPYQFGKEIQVLDTNRRTAFGRKIWNDVQAAGMVPVTPTELDKARAIVAALKANKAANRLLIHGKKERTIIQPRPAGLLPLKARLDVHCEAKRLIVELKTTRDLGVIRASMERYRYPLSAAFYRDMVHGQATVFVFVQTTPPHDIEIMDFPRSQLEEGRDQWKTALRRFDDCWRRNDWPEMESPALADDDDPLMLPGTPLFQRGPARFDIPVGELTL